MTTHIPVHRHGGGTTHDLAPLLCHAAPDVYAHTHCVVCVCVCVRVLYCVAYTLIDIVFFFFFGTENLFGFVTSFCIPQRGVS